MIENFTDVGVRISKEMDKLGLKQVDICRSTGISKNAMSNYVNGNRIPDTMAIYKLSKALNTSIESLLTGEGASLHKDDVLDTESIQITDAEKDMIKKFKVLKQEDKEELLTMLDMKYDRHLKKEMSSTSQNGRGAGTNETA